MKTFTKEERDVIDEASWKCALDGQTWDDYTKGVTQLYEWERHKGNNSPNRNDLLRPIFNTYARPDNGAIVPEGVKKFYSDRHGLFGMVLAYEIGKHDLLEQRLRHADSLFSEQEYAFVVEDIRKRPYVPTVLDHGAGMCHTSLGMLRRGFNTTIYDYITPCKNAIVKSLGIYGRQMGLVAEELRLVDASFYKVDECGMFDLIVSQDVLEHVIDPVDEINRISNSLRVGGLLLMGTFFNSCNGEDPQHLREHDRFQDTALWFAEVEKAGLELVGRDARGVEKVWRKK